MSSSALHLVALSGGADSVALLRVLLALGYRVEAMHCNFHLRGEESDRDETFCKELCNSLEVPLHLIHFDTREYAALHKVSIEMAARDLRYRYFRQLRYDLGAETVCVAHHRDDQAETVLLNLLRGTGIEGLKGMLPENGFVVRPLLCVSRKDITDYLHSIKQDFITDSSNLEADVQRNKLRLNVIPLLNDINPSAVENIAACAERVADAMPIFHKAVEEASDRVMDYKANDIEIIISKLLAEPSSRTVLWDILKLRGFSPAQVSHVYENLQGRIGSVWSSDDYNLVIDRDRIIVKEKSKTTIKPQKIPETGTYVLLDNRKIHLTERLIDENFIPSREADIATLDADAVRFPLILRLAKEGDRFVPFGMKGSKLVSDYLTDIKVSLLDKQQQLVLEDADGRIVWLVGRRTSNVCRITKVSTRTLTVHVETCQ